MIHVSNSDNDSLKSQLKVFYNTFKNLDVSPDVSFDLTDLDFIYPLVALPIGAYIHENKAAYTLPQNMHTKDYLEYVKFPQGVDSLNILQRLKDFIPISFLDGASDPLKRDKVLSAFADLVYRHMGKTHGAQSAIRYPMDELVNNIFEHSKKKYGFIFGQAYMKKKFLDLCIVDTGRGLAKCFKDELGRDFTHLEALREAVGGLSAKDRHERGFGIQTSKRLTCEGLKGEFILVSGNAGLYADQNGNQIFELPGFFWQGVVLSYRIPFITHPFDIYPYVE